MTWTILHLPVNEFLFLLKDDPADTADTSYREEIAAVDVTPTKPKTPKKKEDPKKENHKHKWIFS